MSKRPRVPRVLLIWPGGRGSSTVSFGWPGLVSLASYVEAHTSADVTLRDLRCEAVMGSRDVMKAFCDAPDSGYDVYGFSVYSSHDFLVCEELAKRVRARWPAAQIVAGGYHPSACPEDFVYPGSPFDCAVIGEGELPLRRIVEAVEGGKPLRGIVLGPEAIERLDDLPEQRWSLLDRYRPLLARHEHKLELSLSRGCPFDCSFCMERSKGRSRWRAYSVERALHEVESFHRAFDVSGVQLSVADPLFGAKRSWRRELLEGLARRELPYELLWVHARVDLLDADDVDLFARCRAGVGLGIESGDPEMLSLIQKSKRPEAFLDGLRSFAGWARDASLPWGANLIVGHPGETTSSLKRSAAYISELMVGEPTTTGFISVDPFRLYPGSTVALRQREFSETYGTRFHRPRWWHDGDQGFLAEWVDPSAKLTYLERERLAAELFTPILTELPERFAFPGSSRRFFFSSMKEQLRVYSKKRRKQLLERYVAWQGYLGRELEAEGTRMKHPLLAG